MKRYVKAVLGGLLAIAAAFGWVSAIVGILAWRGVDFAVALFTPKMARSTRAHRLDLLRWIFPRIPCCMFEKSKLSHLHK